MPRHRHSRAIGLQPLGPAVFALGPAVFVTITLLLLSLPLSSAQAQACAGQTVIPVINGITPSSAPVGATVKLQVSWTGVGACLEKVTFANTKSPLAVWDGIATVTAVVPNRDPGPAPIIVDMYVGGPSNPFPFEVLAGGFVDVISVRDQATASGSLDFSIHRDSDGALVDDGSFGVTDGTPASATAAAAVAALEEGGLGPGIVSVLESGNGDIVVSATEPFAFSVCPGPTPCPPGAFEIPPSQIVHGQTWSLALQPNLPSLAPRAFALLSGLLLAIGAATATRATRAGRSKLSALAMLRSG